MEEGGGTGRLTAEGRGGCSEGREGEGVPRDGKVDSRGQGRVFQGTGKLRAVMGQSKEGDENRRGGEGDASSNALVKPTKPLLPTLFSNPPSVPHLHPAPSLQPAGPCPWPWHRPPPLAVARAPSSWPSCAPPLRVGRPDPTPPPRPLRHGPPTQRPRCEPWTPARRAAVGGGWWRLVAVGGGWRPLAPLAVVNRRVPQNPTPPPRPHVQFERRQGL
eukprot:351762-Chlamydomonas_euryale.AAC.3